MKKIRNTLIGSVIVLLISGILMQVRYMGSIPFLAMMVAMISFAVFIISLPFYIIQRRALRHQKVADDATLPTGKLSHRLMEHYKQAGLSDSDIVFFRQTMAEAEKTIRHLDKAINDTPKLKTIDLNLDIIKVSKSMFAAIVKEPQRMAEASDFLYKHLPTITKLSDKYIEISHHEIKTTDTWEVLAKSLDVIKNLGNQIRKDYTTFVADDLDDMDDEMSVAKDSLSDLQKDADKMDAAMQKINETYQRDKEQQHG
ncbi:5-bromo-4-chloroindolyl phosphate hydrolysis family protein [Agrilactobacillus fermenti]|uniref:5-bromo-4-chloroindolyl phosphate hydrolysis family protein n=1 Tax=Agrilactobacillus fermenti TaxID=2586909 RepID=UPI001E5CBF6A|nr:5-bromo-4-chloroindolyl phosphate hydrolysis family protein [Agrilactobacillus fermenti]MCD2255299.1 5-bromo-4-chloroindolyl phosphate hydrolysis family protein [Agrilactobacillus fermenti]